MGPHDLRRRPLPQASAPPHGDRHLKVAASGIYNASAGQTHRVDRSRRPARRGPQVGAPEAGGRRHRDLQPEEERSMPDVGSGILIGKVFGIEIRIEWSWLLIFLLITWDVYIILPELNDTWSRGFRLVLALVASALFFLSVLAHELAHSLVSRAKGLDVRSI